jgi:hypothetical protein
LSSSLLEELAVIMCSRRAIDLPLCIYTNLMNICIINFDFKKNKFSNTSPILETTQNFQSCKYTTYMPQTSWFTLFLSIILDYSISSYFQRDNVFNPKLTGIFCN